MWPGRPESLLCCVEAGCCCLLGWLGAVCSLWLHCPYSKQQPAELGVMLPMPLAGGLSVCVCAVGSLLCVGCAPPAAHLLRCFAGLHCFSLLSTCVVKKPVGHPQAGRRSLRMPRRQLLPDWCRHCNITVHPSEQAPCWQHLFSCSWNNVRQTKQMQPPASTTGCPRSCSLAKQQSPLNIHHPQHASKRTLAGAGTPQQNSRRGNTCWIPAL